ncbi:hypothetical protein [Paraburkholderia largidicola]|uniref:Uncharacterized protein n=1 Tax=Paraburkholderia largidicola TaxID=3014751 RepID=A0A7I8C2J0_9BURK|nr:hypothetical protein [Paraburkholderia sp. PGU16]BCF95287.1 hypothetical protein PPGU16_83540 [Paraburkholderia sp. PGU16]
MPATNVLKTRWLELSGWLRLTRAECGVRWDFFKQRRQPKLYKFIVGQWPSPWACDPHLPVRVAINAHERAIVILHQRVDESWIPFGKWDDRYVRDVIMDEIDMVIEDPKAYGMRSRGDIPATWVYDEAHPGEVNIGCPVPTPVQEHLCDCAVAFPGRLRKAGPGHNSCC